MKPTAPAEQAVTVIADAGEGKQTLEFEKKGDALASRSKLPEGEGYLSPVTEKSLRRFAGAPWLKQHHGHTHYDQYAGLRFMCRLQFKGNVVFICLPWPAKKTTQRSWIKIAG